MNYNEATNYICTISCHGGSAHSKKHNERDEELCEKEPHIDLTRPHENWINEFERDMYIELFAEAHEEYNAKQKRNDRKKDINDYYNTIAKDPKKHTCYEMIVGLYVKAEYTNKEDVNLISFEDYKSRKFDAEAFEEKYQKIVLERYFKEWDKRNPNLKLCGAYYHFDEEGQPHLHLDYIPFGVGFKQGLQAQASLSKALANQGFETKMVPYLNSKGEEKKLMVTRQQQWQESERKALEEITKDLFKNIDVVRNETKEEKLQHRSTDLFKLDKAIEGAENLIKGFEEDIDDLELKQLKESIKLDESKKDSESLDKEIFAKEYEVDKLDLSIADLKSKEKDLEAKSKELETIKSQIEDKSDELNEVNKSLSESSKKLLENEKAIETTNDELKLVKHDLNTINSDLKSKREESSLLNEKITKQVESFNKNKGILERQTKRVEDFTSKTIEELANETIQTVEADIQAKLDSILTKSGEEYLKDILQIKTEEEIEQSYKNLEHYVKEQEKHPSINVTSEMVTNMREHYDSRGEISLLKESLSVFDIKYYANKFKEWENMKDNVKSLTEYLLKEFKETINIAIENVTKQMHIDR